MPSPDLHLQAQCLLLGLDDEASRRSDANDDWLARAVRLQLHELRVPTFVPTKLLHPVRTRSTLRAEVARASFVIAEISDPDPAVTFYLGLAQMLGKPVVTLRRFDADAGLPFERLAAVAIPYDASDDGRLELRKALGVALDAMLRDHTRDLDAFTPNPRDTDIPWSRLSTAGHENLCLDLLMRQGLESPCWLSASREIDLIGIRSREDGGHDLWLVSIGAGLDATTVDGWLHDLPAVRRAVDDLERHGPLVDPSTKPTVELAFVWSPELGDAPLAIDRDIMQQVGQRLVETLGRPLTLRTRRFHRQRLDGAIREEPLILRQHFFADPFGEGPDRRVDLEGLYRETARVARRAIETAARLEEQYGKDPGRRWQEKAYSLTHSIGNAIFPIETYLDFLHERFTDEDSAASRQLAELMDHCLGCIHKAKVHIRRFKKIARYERPELRPVDVLPRIERSLDIAKREGVRIEFHAETRGLMAVAEPDEVDELLDELVRNSLYWLRDAEDPRISVRAQAVDAESLPPEIAHRDHAFLWIRYRDSGPGVPDERKERIFELSYSTNPQGMGYGLALVRNNLERFGGTVAETGLEGHGVQFDLYLPAVGGSSNPMPSSDDRLSPGESTS